MRAFFLVISAAILGPATASSAMGTQQPWQSYVYGFRSAHNFALSLGVGRGQWRIQRFGPITGETVPLTGLYARASYAFHLPLPIAENVGYFVGSSIGYLAETSEKRDLVRAGLVYQLPGLLVGWVADLGPMIRIGGAAETYLERVEEMEGRHEGESYTASITLVSFADLQLFVDIFYSLGWGVRLEYHSRWLSHQRPRKADGQMVDADLTKADHWLAIGAVHHLL